MLFRVLLADPDESLLASYRAFLSGNDFAVHTVTNGLDCIAQLRSFQPDVLVLDPDVPWGWGSGVLALLNEESDLPQVPVLLLTTRSEAECRALEIEYPLCEYQVKPMPPPQLANRVRQLLERTPVPGGFFG